MTALATEQTVYGDCNGDKEINVRDATLIQRAIVFDNQSDYLPNGDVDNDGIVTIKDATNVQKLCAKLISCFPRENETYFISRITNKGYLDAETAQQAYEYINSIKAISYMSDDESSNTDKGLIYSKKIEQFNLIQCIGIPLPEDRQIRFFVFTKDNIVINESVSNTIDVDYSECIEVAKNTYVFFADEIRVTAYQGNVAYKPVIYLYPEKTTDIDVKLKFNGTLTCTYPKYSNGWSVTAKPDGSIYNKNDGNEYTYLFWEGKSNVQYVIDQGFCVKGSDTVSFLREKLSYLGLTPKEYNEFIVYWLPQMQDNPYNVIKFQTDSYTDNARLEVSPKPDTELRVFMTYKSSDKYIVIPEQMLEHTNRNGFTLVEWGGSCIG